MRLNKRVAATLAVATMALFQSACDSNSLPQGNFEGSMLRYEDYRMKKQPVHSTLTWDDHGSGTLAIRDIHQELLQSISLVPTGDGTYRLTLPGILPYPVDVSLDSGCLKSAGSWLSLCYSQDKFLLDVKASDQSTLFSLSGDQFQAQPAFAMESPTAYSLDEAVGFALKRNFDTRAEVDQVLQAKHSAKAAYLNLLPHLSFATALSNLAPDITSILGAIGDLAPFLLPTRWIQADEAHLASRAEVDALVILRADTATQVEGLAYALERDKATISLYQYLILRAATARQKTFALERQKKMPEGSTAHIDATIDSMNLDLSAFQTLVKQDRSAIAQAMGLHSPEAVQDILFGNEVNPIEQAENLRAEELSDVALSHSFELDQMDYLIQVAQDQKDATYFNWLDPAGDPTANLGLNLGENVAVAANRVDELMTKREQLQQTLAQNVFGSVDQFNQALGDRSSVLKAMNLENERLNRVIGQITPDSSLNTLDIEAVLQDYLAMGIRKETLLAQFRIARSKIDRVLLHGLYSKLPVHKYAALN